MTRPSPALFRPFGLLTAGLGIAVVWAATLFSLPVQADGHLGVEGGMADATILFDRRLAQSAEKIAAEARLLESAERMAEDLLAGRQPSNKNLVFPWPRIAARMDQVVQSFGGISVVSDFDEKSFANDLEESRVCGVQVAALKRLRAQSRALDLGVSRAGQYLAGLDRQADQIERMKEIVTNLIDNRARLDGNQFARYVFVGDWSAVEVALLPSLLELERLTREVRSRMKRSETAFGENLERIDDVIERTKARKCAIAGRWYGDCEDAFGRPTPAMKLSLSLSEDRKIGNLQVGDKSWPASALRFSDRSELRFRVQSGNKSYRFEGLFSADFRSIDGYMGDRTEPKFWTCNFVTE
ncbi:MAG: hypothetical protein ACPGOV_12900 [Magnetovibrionaceae bacterium]